MSTRFHRREFRAMGTTCAVAVVADVDEHEAALRALAAARAEVDKCERVLTRFNPRSDLSRLNHASGTWVEVDVRLLGALRAALRARRETHGRFDPTVLPALLAAGYDRTFDELEHRPAQPLKGWRPGAAVAIDEDRCRARVEAGAAVDLGGIGKGYSATRALDAMRAAFPGLEGGLVDLGGDLAFRGRSPDGAYWRVAVADPCGGADPIVTLRIAGGGVATSGRNRRRFGPNGRLHHLIDPATGEPAREGPLAVTVVAPSATEAEAYATPLAISGVGEAAALLERRSDLSALYVPDSGSPIVLGPLPTIPRVRLVMAA